MQKLLSVLLAMTVLLTLFPLGVIPVSAADISDLTYQIVDGEVTITNCSNTARGEIVIPATIEGYPVTTIGSKAFRNCTYLTSISIPDSVVTIEDSSFYHCSGLTSIFIPDSVIAIGSSVFSSCDNLTAIEVDENNPEYCSMDGVLYTKDMTVLLKYPSGQSGAYIVPDGVTTIERGAISGSDALTAVTIPDSVVAIGSNFGCDNLTAIDVDENNSYYSSLDGVLFSKDKTILLDYPCGRSGAYIVPDDVTTICDNAFGGSKITSVTISDSVTDMGEEAFSFCRSLRSVTIGKGIATIGESTFSNCTSLTSVTMKEGVTAIEAWAFGSCTNLTSIYIPDGVTTIGDHAFYDCRNLVSVTIPASVTTIGEDAFMVCGDITSVYISDIAAWCTIDFGSSYSNPLTHNDATLYLNNETITDLTIPSGVSTISNYAFYTCDSLTSVILPDGVTSIGHCAFGGCTNLASVTLPKGVTSVGESTFSGCAIKSITLPEGVTSIGKSAFSGCASLTSVTLPNSITAIGPFVFSSCISLSTITIPETITTIYTGAFQNSGLVFVRISNNVTRIQSQAFSGCEKLMLIAIGDGLERINYRAFQECENLTDVYYVGTKMQWDAVKIEHSNDCLLDATVHYNSTGPEEWPIIASPSEHIIKVVDSSGNSIHNAEVQVTQTGMVSTYNTKDTGYVIFEKASTDAVDFTITADDYIEYTTVGENFTLSETGCDVIILYTSEESKLKLTKAIYQNTDSSYNEVMGFDVNLIKGTKRLSSTNDDKGYFRIQCSTADTSQVKGYVLYQNGRVVQVSEDGTFNLRIADFEAGKNIYVTVLGKDGAGVSTLLNLEICEDINVEEASVSFGNSVAIQVPDSVPFIGGTEIACSIPNMPIQFTVEDGKIYAGLNVNFTKDKSIKEQFKEINTLMEDVRKLSNYRVGKNLKGNITKFLKSREKFNIPAVGKVEAMLFGAGEATWSENGLDEIQIQAYFLIDVSTKKNWQTMVWVVPVTVNIKAGVKGKAEATINWDAQKKELNGDLELDIKPQLNVFGGTGVGAFIGVGAYGEAEVDIDIQLLGTTISPGLNYVDLTGEMGLKVYAGPYTYEKPFAHNTWHIYTRTNALRYANSPRLYYSDIFDTDNYAIDDVSYLADQSIWLGNRTGENRLPIGSEDDGVITVRPLLLNTYRNLQPSVAASLDDAVMVYIGADTDRTAQNIPSVMYSVYDAANEIWSEPVQLDSNLTADAAPMVYSDGVTIRLVYQDASVEYGNDLAVEEYLDTQNIVIYAYDSNTNTFVLEKTFLTSGKQYRTPKLTDVNGVPALVWIASEDSDLFGQGDNNQFLCSYYRNGGWTEPTVLLDGVCTISDYTVGEIDGKLSVLYAADADNDLSTDIDRSIMRLNADGRQTLSEGATDHLMFTMLPSEKEESFVWVSEEALYVLGADGETRQVCYVGDSESLTVVGNKILFTAADDGNSEIYAVVYDEEAGTYGSPVQISAQEKYIERLNGVNFNGTELLVMTRKAVTISEDTVTDDCEFAWALLNDKTDLKINSVEYDYSDIKDGEIPLYISVSNQGSVLAHRYMVSVKDADSNIVVEQSFDETFLAGEAKDIVIMMPLNDVTEIADYVVAVGESVGEENDFKMMTIGYADLAISTDAIKVGDQNMLVCTVTNNGLSVASGKLKVYERAEEKLISVAIIDNLSPGAMNTYVVGLTSETTERILTCVVTSDAEDYSEVNNAETIYFDFSEFTEPECQHVYDDDHDTGCNACGAVREIEAVPGDANRDGKTNVKDLGLLQQKLNGWDVSIAEDAMDLNGDSKVNIKDLGLLQQYLNGWDVQLQ